MTLALLMLDCKMSLEFRTLKRKAKAFANVTLLVICTQSCLGVRRVAVSSGAF